jgi:hypothetical protein
MALLPPSSAGADPPSLGIFELFGQGGGFTQVQIVNGQTTGYIVFFDQVRVPFNFDNNFHTYSFQVDSNGTGRWLRDNILQRTVQNFPVGNYIVRLRGTGILRFDNVTVDLE